MSALDAYPGHKVFDYHGEVDILGWRFLMKTNGELWIRTSDFTPALREDGTTCAEMRLSASVVDLLQALIRLREPGEVTAYAPGTHGVGVPQ